MKIFKSYHPVTNFIYFAFVIVFSVIYMHPVCLFISFLCAFAFACILSVKRAAKFNLKFVLPLFVVTALINPLFNHEGMTVLTYFKSGNPLTAESIIYGIASGGMMCAVINWFFCFNEIMESDKILCLTGKIFPSLSLVFSMTLRFVPRFATQMHEVSNAQKGIGFNGVGVITKVKNGLRVLSIMLTSSLENSVETADSMKSRGFATGRRTSFSVYRMTVRDIVAILLMLILGLYVIILSFFGVIDFTYFPLVKSAELTSWAISVFVMYFILAVYPVIIEIREIIRWNVLKSKI